ncbi:hypothetical protein [endosymbiont of unidentified scaly snail isolate Monju]|uniref:hypothetical protein n=1 Tax=endosymbiont of unidentified scaly snail isolate Monju TaxID=1248727 RepID=UPI0003892A4D|nr:hypothetical protein [endosymbiont of unidentified scaly snail isolate Monju]BAN68434.1 conserved hypothetical protein [endosymbiont of unidentified scaly snail isolate Monju]
MSVFLFPLLALAVAGVLLSRPLRSARGWRATVTPLASIIGSGFLVVAPVLGRLLGRYAILGMTGITLVALTVGAVMRFNIRHLEPLLERGALDPLGLWLERAANLALSLAYVISVAFYLRLLSAFALRPLVLEQGFWLDALTTLVLVFIGGIGWRRGLHALENLEEYSVSIKLAVIAALLAGLAVHDLHTGFDLSAVHAGVSDPWEIARVLAGLLLVVQGFETSRYLGAEYDAGLRVRSMRRAQWLSTTIYLAFLALVTPLLGGINGARVDETAVIDLAAAAAWILGPMLILAALMSQFSAAVADTVGAGGLVQEESRGRIHDRQAYPLIALLAIILVWSADLFEIVSLASRAFAFYYLLQTLLALRLAFGWRQRLGFGLVAALLAFVVLFGKAVG